MDPRDEDALMMAVLQSRDSRSRAVFGYCLKHRLNDWSYAERFILEDLEVAMDYQQALKTNRWPELEMLIEAVLTPDNRRARQIRASVLLRYEWTCLPKEP